MIAWRKAPWIRSFISRAAASVKQKYYYLAQIDPDFRLLTDETERALLRESVWEDLREELYGKFAPYSQRIFAIAH